MSFVPSYILKVFGVFSPDSHLIHIERLMLQRIIPLKLETAYRRFYKVYDSVSSAMPKRTSTACCNSALFLYAVITCFSCVLSSSSVKCTSSKSLGDTFNALQIRPIISASGLFMPCSQFDTLLLVTFIFSANCACVNPLSFLYLRILFPILYFKKITSLIDIIHENKVKAMLLSRFSVLFY